MHLRLIFYTICLLVLVACARPSIVLSPTPTSTIPPSLAPPTSTANMPPTSTPAPTPVPTRTPVPTPTPTIARDHTSLEVLLAEPPPRPLDYVVVNPTPPRRVPNAIRSFWIIDHSTDEKREITARLRAQTARAAMWMEEGVWHDVRALQQAAHRFETEIYSPTRAVFGAEWTPGIDNDPRTHILHARLSDGVLGYTSSGDDFPNAVYPYSNEAALIVVHTGVEIGGPTYDALLTRCFQRIIQRFQDRNEKRWVKEGMAELAVHLLGLRELQTNEEALAYLEQPDASLTTWRVEEETAEMRHRGAAYLFAVYFQRRFGDEGVRELMSQSPDGIAGFDATLDALGSEQTFEDLFGDWLIANYLNADIGDAKSPYTYAALNLPRPALAASYTQYPVTFEATVQQFGVDYISLQGDADLAVQFTGRPTVTLLSPAAHSGRYYWWSNRADASMTTLVRSFDFSEIEAGRSITMTYWAWRDIEVGYDQVEVEASADGDEWCALPPSPEPDDVSRQWTQEQVDLSLYAGTQVTVRFKYLTDEAVTGEGFFVDDIAVPVIGYTDDAESATPTWEPHGFIHSDGRVRQRYLVYLIGLKEKNASAPTIERLHFPLDQEIELNGQVSVEWIAPLKSEGWAEAVLVVSGLAPVTSYPASYAIGIAEK